MSLQWLEDIDNSYVSSGISRSIFSKISYFVEQDLKTKFLKDKCSNLIRDTKETKKVAIRSLYDVSKAFYTTVQVQFDK